LFPVLEELGHTLIPKRPALAPVKLDLQSFVHLQGVRLDAGVDLWDGENRLAGSAGNILFAEWGINGPGAMDISHFISAHPGKSLHLSLDFLRFYKTEFEELLQQKQATAVPVKIFLEAFFQPKVASLFCSLAQIPETTPLKAMNEAAQERLIRHLRETRLTVKGVKGFEVCQLSAGGIPVTEVDPLSMESQVVKGLHLTGETLDVVGPCGGFNLHFAFASGALAGRAAGQAG
jgi:predicted Rossmann fold flavoprotein